jgi:hypothetical protein
MVHSARSRAVWAFEEKNVCRYEAEASLVCALRMFMYFHFASVVPTISC